MTLALSSLILAVLRQGMEKGQAGGPWGPTQSRNVSAFHLAWLSFSSQVRDENDGSEEGGEGGFAGRWGIHIASTPPIFRLWQAVYSEIT